MAEMDLSVFRKQRRVMEKRDRRKKRKEDVMAIPKEHQMKDEKVIDEIRTLENKIIEDFALKKDLEKEMKETRAIMYVVLAVTLAIFAFLIGVLVRYVGS